MSFKARLLFVSLALAALVGLLVLGSILSPGSLEGRAALRPLVSITAIRDVDAIRIGAGSSQVIILQKQAEGWEARAGGRSYPASTSKVESFLQYVRDLTRGRLVSRNSLEWDELGLGKDAALTLSLELGPDKPPVDLWVGKRAASGDEDYVLVQPDTAVYLVRGALSFYLSKEPEYWRGEPAGSGR